MSNWKIHPDINTYFITSTIVNWTAVFKETPFFTIIIDSLKHCQDHKGLIIYGYVIMPDHIHLLVTSEGNLSNIMRDFKSFTSKQITDLLQQREYNFTLKLFQNAAIKCEKSDDYKVWQDGFHPIGIYTEKFYHQKLNYIHQNPVKAGYVAKPEHWYYSSARNYAGMMNYPLKVEIL